MYDVAVTTTTPPVKVVSFQCINHNYNLYSGFHFHGLDAASGRYDVVLPPPLILRDTIRGVVGLATVPQQQPQSQMPSQTYANYAMVTHQVSFLVQS